MSEAGPEATPHHHCVLLAARLRAEHGGHPRCLQHGEVTSWGN